MGECLAKKCLGKAKKAKKAAEAAQVALTGTGTGVGEGGIVEKQLAMEQSLATIKGVFGTGFVNCGNGGDCGNGWESQNGKSNGFSGTIDERFDKFVRVLFAMDDKLDLLSSSTSSQSALIVNQLVTMDGKQIADQTLLNTKLDSILNKLDLITDPECPEHPECPILGMQYQCSW